jgi:hypothetical protein
MEYKNVINKLQTLIDVYEKSAWRVDYTGDVIYPVLRDAITLLKEQESDIIAMSRFLESHGFDSESICGKLVEVVVFADGERIE